MGVESIPAIIFTVLVTTIPKSPRWLIEKNRINQAKEVLLKIYPDQNSDDLILSINESNGDYKSKETIFNKKMRIQFQFFSQKLEKVGFLQLLFVMFLMPETKGISLEDISRKLISNDYN